MAWAKCRQSSQGTTILLLDDFFDVSFFALHDLSTTQEGSFLRTMEARGIEERNRVLGAAQEESNFHPQMKANGCITP